MTDRSLSTIIRLGFITGMRGTSGATALSHRLSQNPSPHLAGTPFALLQNPQTAVLLKLMAAGELVGDKLPFVPARIAPGPLFGRLVGGAIVGAAAARSMDENTLNGAVIGGGSAILGAFVGYFARRWAHQILHIPDPVLAVTEDSFVALVARSTLD